MLHPPYADAIRYSVGTPGDLSHLAAGPFLTQLRQVAAESRRVLAPDGRCALLLGDLRRQGRVVPLGFAAIQAFRGAGFVLEELIIKRQHQTRLAERWAPVGAQRGFLLLAHEYLAVFRRTAASPHLAVPDQGSTHERYQAQQPSGAAGMDPTTTVWAMPPAAMETAIPEAVQQVFGRRNQQAVRFLRLPQALVRTAGGAPAAAVSGWLDQVMRSGHRGAVLAIEARDVRWQGELQPVGLEVCRLLRRTPGVRLQEIVVVVPAAEVALRPPPADPLAITHRYLLVATRDRGA